MSLQTSPMHLDAIRRAAAAAFPEECCGLLLGWKTGTEKTAGAIQPIRNDAAADTRGHRYAVAPRDLLENSERALEMGMEVVGFYHSHPDAPARPSTYDTERAWAGYSYLIVAVRDGVPDEIASWVLDGDGRGFSRERLLNGAQG